MAVELASGYVSIVPSARGFGQQLGREIGPDLDRVGDESGRRAGGRFTSSFTAGFGRIGAALAAAFAGTQVVQFLSGSVSAASDLAEAGSRVDVVFGDAAGTIQEWAQDASTAFGQSRTDALSAAGSFGNLFTQLGIGSGVAADMSTTMVELASDFASFHNADTVQVTEAMSAAFRGEYDALQRFVPTINAAAVQQRAMEMTGKANAAALTEQEKAAATYALMLEGAGEAVGDFDRTSDGLANRQRILSAQFEDTKAKIGEALIPVVSSLVNWISTKLIPGVEMLVAKVREFWPAVQEFFAPAVEWFQTVLVPVVSEVVGKIIAGFQSIIDWVRTIWPQIVGAFDTVLGIIKEVWSRFGDEITERATIVWDGIKLIVESAIKIVRDVINFVLAILNGDWGKAWDAIKGIADTVWGLITGLVDLAIRNLKNILSLGMELVKGAWDLAWEAIKTLLGLAWDAITTAVDEGIDGILGFFRDLPGNILGAVGDIASKVLSIGSDIVSGILSGIARVGRQIWDKIMSFIPTPSEIVGAIGGGGVRGNLEERARAGSNAKGTRFWKGGLSWVGEEGPELVNLPRGAQVFPHGQSMAMAGNGEEVALLREQNALLRQIARNGDLRHLVRTA